eukprot:scaffold24358_cov60-Phaeocystis_antarctica.AAC.3
MCRPTREQPSALAWSPAGRPDSAGRTARSHTRCWRTCAGAATQGAGGVRRRRGQYRWRRTSESCTASKSWRAPPKVAAPSSVLSAPKSALRSFITFVRSPGSVVSSSLVRHHHRTSSSAALLGLWRSRNSMTSAARDKLSLWLSLGIERDTKSMSRIESPASILVASRIHWDRSCCAKSAAGERPGPSSSLPESIESHLE